MSRPVRVWPAAALLPVLVAGTVKAAGFTAIGGVDFTLLGLALLLGASVVTFVQHPRYPVREMLPFLLFALVVLVGVTRSDPGDYQALKARDFFLLTGVIVACVPVLLRDLRDLRGLLAAWMVGGTLAALLVLQIGGSETLNGRAGINDATLGPAYLSAAALVIGAAGMGERLIPPMLALPAIAVTGVALVSIGSRGPMIGAALGFVSWVLIRGVLHARTLLMVVAFLGAVYAGFRLAPEGAALRLHVLEDPAREDLAAIARATFLESPFVGLGWGDYATVSWANYPHNLFLEAAAELGLVGLLSYLALIVAVASRVVKHRHHSEVRVLAALVCVLLVGGMLSFELTDRTVWVALSACLLVPTMVGSASIGVPIRRAQEGHQLHGTRPPVRGNAAALDS